MLQRSGIALLLNMITVGSYLVLVTIGHVMNPSAGCMLESSSKIPVSRESFCIPAIFCGVAVCILEMSFLEFVIAQTAAKLNGLIVGMWDIFRGMGHCISIVLPFAFLYLSNVPPSCGFLPLFDTISDATVGVYHLSEGVSMVQTSTKRDHRKHSCHSREQLGEAHESKRGV